MTWWLGERFSKCYPLPSFYVTYEAVPGIEGITFIEQPDAWQSTSGLYAVEFAAKNYDKVVLAGIPLQKGRSIHSGNVSLRNDTKVHDMCRRFGKHLKPKCRSMGGWTREWLEAPTQAWLSS